MAVTAKKLSGSAGLSPGVEIQERNLLREVAKLRSAAGSREALQKKVIRLFCLLASARCDG
jgi:hypothetical protein